MKKVKITVIVIISLLALIIFFQNTEVVETKVLFFNIAMSRALLLILTFGLGFAAGLVASLMWRKSRNSEVQN